MNSSSFAGRRSVGNAALTTIAATVRTAWSGTVFVVATIVKFESICQGYPMSPVQCQRLSAGVVYAVFGVELPAVVSRLLLGCSNM